MAHDATSTSREGLATKASRPNPSSMRALIHEYLNRRLSRRDFIARVAAAGFSVAAATSLSESVASLIDAEAEASAGGAPTMVEGTGAELLVAQLRAADVRFVFNCTSAG